MIVSLLTHMSYIIAPLSKVKDDFPEFLGVMKDLENKLRTRSEKIWNGFTFGGLTPGDNQFGLVNIPPRHMSIPRGFGTWSYLQKFSASGSWTNIYSYTVPEDQIHGFAGFGFQGPNMIFNAIRLQISDVIFPIIELEEARMWAKDDGLGIILKTDVDEDLIVQEKVSMVLKGWQQRNTDGFTMRITPIGLMSYKVKDDLISLASPSA